MVAKRDDRLDRESDGEASRDIYNESEREREKAACKQRRSQAAEREEPQRVRGRVNTRTGEAVNE